MCCQNLDTRTSTSTHPQFARVWESFPSPRARRPPCLECLEAGTHRRRSPNLKSRLPEAPPRASSGRSRPTSSAHSPARFCPFSRSCVQSTRVLSWRWPSPMRRWSAGRMWRSFSPSLIDGWSLRSPTPMANSSRPSRPFSIRRTARRSSSCGSTAVPCRRTSPPSVSLAPSRTRPRSRSCSRRSTALCLAALSPSSMAP